MECGSGDRRGRLERSPTAQQSVAVTQVTATSEVIGAPGTLRVLADQNGPASGRAGPAAGRGGQQKAAAEKAGGDQRKDAEAWRRCTCRQTNGVTGRFPPSFDGRSSLS